MLFRSHTNKINGKKYIGITRQDIRRRWRAGKGYEKKSQPKFYNAIRKYGWDSFSHEIIEKDIKTIEHANEREIYWIKYYNSFKNGYNGTIGGGGTIGTNEKKIIQLDMIGKVIKEHPSIRSASIKNDISYSNIAQCVLHSHKSAGGYHWISSKEYKNMSCREIEQWIEEVNTNNSQREDIKIHQRNACMKEILQFDINGNYIKEWKSNMDVCSYYGVNHRSVSVCRNKLFDGYIWITKEKYEKMEEFEFKEYIINSKTNNTHSIETNSKRAISNIGRIVSEETKDKIRKKHIGKTLTLEHREKIGYSQRIPIVQLSINNNFIKEWDGSKYAQRLGGFDGSAIIKCCKGKYKQHKGYRWMYASEYYNPETDKDLPIYVDTKNEV